MQTDGTGSTVLAVNEQDLITFPQGIPGFPHVHRYVVRVYREGSVLHTMQGVDDPTVVFGLIDPRTCVPDYKVEVDQDDVAVLQLDGADEAVVLSIVTVTKDDAAATVNLRAPLVVNPRTGIGVQVMLPDSPYSIRYPLSLASDGSIGPLGASKPTAQEAG